MPFKVLTRVHWSSKPNLRVEVPRIVCIGVSYQRLPMEITIIGLGVDMELVWQHIVFFTVARRSVADAREADTIITTSRAMMRSFHGVITIGAFLNPMLTFQ